jgi:ATP synthase protein I
VRLDRKSLRAASYSTVGLELSLSILFGMLGGRWLDGRFGTEPWLTFVSLGFGCAAGFRFVYRAATRMRKDADSEPFHDADLGRPARFAMGERHAAARARRAARDEGRAGPKERA